MKVGRGWFETVFEGTDILQSDNKLNELTVPPVSRRVKAKLDGQAFIVPQKRESWDRVGGSGRLGTLYLPYEYFDFEEVPFSERWGEGRERHVIRLKSRSTPVVIEDRNRELYTESLEADALKRSIAQHKREAELAEQQLRNL